MIFTYPGTQLFQWRLFLDLPLSKKNGDESSLLYLAEEEIQNSFVGLH